MEGGGLARPQRRFVAASSSIGTSRARAASEYRNVKRFKSSNFVSSQVPGTGGHCHVDVFGPARTVGIRRCGARANVDGMALMAAEAPVVPISVLLPLVGTVAERVELGGFIFNCFKGPLQAPFRL